MPDREKVIKGLEHCMIMCNGISHNPCDGCEYHGSYDCTDKLKADALALLKEQEAKNVTWRIGRAHCPSCGELFPKKQDKQYIRFCNYCGQAVKW
jgi:hypothetical protein